jgi:hypothetical protein
VLGRWATYAVVTIAWAGLLLALGGWHSLLASALLWIGATGLAVDSAARFARLRRTEGGPFFGSARAPHLLFALFVVWTGFAIVVGRAAGDAKIDTVVVVWLVVASALAAGMVVSERRRTAVRSTA